MLPVKYYMSPGVAQVSRREGRFNSKKHFQLFRGEPADYARARIGINTLLQEMDFAKKRDRREPASFSTRRAVPGDDARKIDWKSSARLDIGQYVVRTPEQRPVFSTPLHVFFDVDFNVYLPEVYFANLAATIDTLQRDVKKRGREVYITSTTMDEYVLLSPKDDPRQLAARLVSIPEASGSTNYETNQGPPRNLIYLSHNEGKVKSIEFLEKDRRTNILARTFDEIGVSIREYIRDDWVEAGKSSQTNNPDEE